ncbi:MAG TPA: MauE/DoxX family redox-associated membrane protein [Kiloniellales bacterium]
MDLLDPVLVWIARLTMVLLFAAAGLSKLRRPAAFRAAVAAYDLLPGWAVAPTAALLAAAEVLGAMLLLWPAGRPAGAVLLGVMLLLFSAAIAVNIARGRTDIDCGCWLFGAEPAEGQGRLGAATLARNGGLAAVLLVASLPAAARLLGVLDWLTIATGTLAAVGLFAMAMQLAVTGRQLAGLRAGGS